MTYVKTSKTSSLFKHPSLCISLSEILGCLIPVVNRLFYRDRHHFLHILAPFLKKKNITHTHIHISVAATLAAAHPSVWTKSTGPVHFQRVPAHRGTPRPRNWCSFTNTSVQELHPTSRALSFCCLQEMESHCLPAHTPDHWSPSILNSWESYRSQAKSP